MAAFQRMYSFLSQIFDYGNTAIEKRFIFYKRLLPPLLEFGREREGIDLSKVVLTHHSLKDLRASAKLILGEGVAPKLQPLPRKQAQVPFKRRRKLDWKRSLRRSMISSRAISPMMTVSFTSTMLSRESC